MDFLTSKLTPMCVLLILLYIGYSELIRPDRLSAKLNQALDQTRQVQAQLQTVKSQLQQQTQDLTQVGTLVNRVDAGLLDLTDSVSVISGRYQAIKSEMDKQTAVQLDHWNQQKKRLQDIQNQVK